MAKLKFGAWIPTYAWSGEQERTRRTCERIRESIEKCEDHGIDVWVIDHLLSAPGLYGNAWLEPLNSLAYAAALTTKVKIATGILVLPVRHPVVLAKEISTLCHLSNNRYVFGVGPGWYAREYEVTGSRIEERGKRTDEIIEAVTLLLTKPNASLPGPVLPVQRRDHRPAPAEDAGDLGVGRLARARPDEHDVPVIAKTVMDRIVKAGNWLSRCSGTQEWVKRDWAQLQAARRGARAGPEGAHLRPLQLHPPGGHGATTRRVAQSKAPFLRAMGTHRTYEHLQECYMVGGDRPDQRAHRRPGGCGAAVPRAGPGDRRSDADRPHGQEGREALQVEAPTPCATASICPRGA